VPVTVVVTAVVVPVRVTVVRVSTVDVRVLELLVGSVRTEEVVAVLVETSLVEDVL
jgi:hypothetical protein